MRLLSLIVLTMVSSAAAFADDPQSSYKAESVPVASGSTASQEQIQQLSAVLPNFHIVAPGIYRGGQPTTQGLTALKRAGIKTVINLRNEQVIVEREKKYAEQIGLRYINIPMDVFNRPAKKVIDQFLKAVDQTADRPVYVHCLHGQDRTGTMIGIYRFARQNWSANEAYGEMLTFGFRPGFSALANGLFDYAEASGRPGKRPSGGSIVTDLTQRMSKKFR